MIPILHRSVMSGAVHRLETEHFWWSCKLATVCGQQLENHQICFKVMELIFLLKNLISCNLSSDSMEVSKYRGNPYSYPHLLQMEILESLSSTCETYWDDVKASEDWAIRL